MKVRRDMSASQGLRFLVVGFSFVALDYIVYLSLLRLWFTVDVAKSIGFLTACFCAYVANKSWTFEATGGNAVATRFVVLYAVSMSVNVGINHYMLQNVGDMNTGFELSYIIATSCSATLNFVGMKFFVFQITKEQN